MAHRGGARLPLMILGMNVRHLLILIAALMVFPRGVARATQVETEGKIAVLQSAPIFAVCTDPIMQTTLDEDIRGAHRAPASGQGSPVTVTVTVNDKLLKPGVVLGDLGPGDPWVIAKLLREAGTEPPPIGDTGNQAPDAYSQTARRQIMEPDDPMAGFRNYEAFHNQIRRPEAPRFGANGNAKDEELYDRAIIARASVGGAPDQMTALVVIHPGEDVRTAKELLAEEIANSILH